MQLFIDSADPKEITEAVSWGFVDGVTTNPSLAAKVGRPYKDIVKDILAAVPGPVSLETISLDFDGMVSEGRSLAKLGSQVVVKVPCTMEGFKATRALKSEGIPVNMTLCFSVNQALLAAKAGAIYISPFLGRVDDISDDSGDELINLIRLVYDNYGFETKILSASIRDAAHVAAVAEMGSDVATVPFAVLKAMPDHPLTSQGLTKFLADWKDSGLSLPI